MQSKVKFEESQWTPCRSAMLPAHRVTQIS